MFKISSFEQELIKEMQSRLVENQVENQYSFNKLAKAADYLNNVAELFDDVGMTKEAEVVTRLLEKLGQEEVHEASPEEISVVDTINDYEKVLGLLVGGKFTLPQLKKIETELHKEIREQGGHPMDSILDTNIEATEFGEPSDELDLNDLRNSKKKV
jgi:hypothetical protein